MKYIDISSLYKRGINLKVVNVTLESIEIFSKVLNDSATWLDSIN